jgi:hypothetical protein
MQVHCSPEADSSPGNVAYRRQVRHPPQSGWLDEWGRLKGGHPSLLVRTDQQGSLELAPLVRVLVVLLTDVRADLR